MIRRNSHSGVTLVELLVSFALILPILLYTLSAYLSAQRAITRANEYSAALFLCQSRLELLQSTPLQEIQTGDTQLAEPFQGYQLSIRLSPWEGDLQVLTVRVSSPRGARAELDTLRQNPSFQGVVTDIATNRVIFSRPGSDLLQSFNTVTTTLSTFGVGLPGGIPAGIGASSGTSLVWATDQTNNTLVPFVENTGVWGPPVTFPSVPGFGQTRLAGVAVDLYGGIVAAADVSNRAIWLYFDDIPGFPRRRFFQNRPIAPVSPPLGNPSGVALNETGSLLIVADNENQCLRKFNLNLVNPSNPPAGYAPEELEEQPGLGFWIVERLRHPRGMGSPQGVVINSSGFVIYTLDRAYLYRLVEPNPGTYRWTRFQLPADLQTAGPSGVALDEFNNLVYITTKDGQLWEYNVSNDNFVRLVP